MTRLFTKNMGRWKKGDIREYPIPTWRQIERGATHPLDSFSKEIEDAARTTMVLDTPDPVRRRGRPVTRSTD